MWGHAEGGLGDWWTVEEPERYGGEVGGVYPPGLREEQGLFKSHL